MANFNSVLATAMAATPSLGGPAEWQLPGVINTPVRCFVDSYTALGTETAGSVIRFFTDGTVSVLPAGANILFFQFLASASTGSLTVSVGDRSSATRYASAGTGLATGSSLVTVSGIVSGAPYIIGTNASTAAFGAETNGDNQIILTTGGATLAVGTIITGIMYFTLTN